MKNKLLFLFILFSTNILAQEHEHHHPEYEIGLSNNTVYNISEKEVAYSIHTHFVKIFKNKEKLGIGLGYEHIFDDHKHNAFSFILVYRPFEHFSMNFAPGIVWLGTQKNSLKPAMHLEGLYEFELGHFHIGPLIGFGFNTEDLHASLGLHLAVGF